MNGGEALVMIIMFTGFFALVFGIVYMNKRENLAMIEKGMNPKSYYRRPVSVGYLKWGLLLMGAGLGLLLAFIIDLNMIPDFQEPAAVYFALLAMGGGAGLVTSYRIEQNQLEKEKEKEG